MKKGKITTQAALQLQAIVPEYVRLVTHIQIFGRTR